MLTDYDVRVIGRAHVTNYGEYLGTARDDVDFVIRNVVGYRRCHFVNGGKRNADSNVIIRELTVIGVGVGGRGGS